jgi:hypothetical protein
VSKTDPEIAFALLSFRPDQGQVAFYEALAGRGYAVFVFVDDNAFMPPEGDSVRYMKIDELACSRRGYTVLNPMISMRKRPRVSAWEKALYFFGTGAGTFKHVWLIEDDVFVPRIDIFPEIDERHPNADLLCRSHKINHFGELKSWDWWKWVPRDVLPLPWAASLVCTVRLSGRLLLEMDRTIVSSAAHMQKLHALVREKKGPFKFLFIEFLFNSIALHKRLPVECPPELSTLLFHKRWELQELDDRHVYHPVKNIGDHQPWRLAVCEGRRA